MVLVMWWKKKKSGKKINTEFEAEVWGNLIMCVLEKNENKEVCHKLIIIKPLFYILYDVVKYGS